MVVIYAMNQLETIYRWGKADPINGFDCSGLIHYMFTKVYGKQMFGGVKKTAAGSISTFLIKE